jgi:hypothetical protein
MARHLIVAASALCGLILAGARAEGGAIFDEVTKDFGSVPRGTTLLHQFRLNNTTGAALHVSGLRTSCGCATATVGKTDLTPGESTVIALTIDTKKYAGSRVFTIFVQIDRPFVEEFRLTAVAHSRDDVTLEPGQLSFGRVKKGTGPRASVTVEYHGGSNWQITGVENDNGYLHPEVQELSRATGLVAYRLTVKLREDTPAGIWHADIWLKTNDASLPRVRVPLVVEIEGNLTATPAEVVLGQLKAGTRAERKVVIRGTQPFRITGIEGTDDRLQVTGQSSEAKAVQVLKVVAAAGGDAQELVRKVRVKTDLPEDNTVEFTVQGQLQP